MNENLSAREGAQPQAAACEETISRQRAVEEVRGMAAQFAELYFAFVCALRDELGEARAMEVVQRVLYRRARERAGQMVERAREMGVARTPGEHHAHVGTCRIWAGCRRWGATIVPTAWSGTRASPKRRGSAPSRGCTAT